MLNDLADQTVRIPYCNMGTLNRIRAWARKNTARVSASRYARDAYEVEVLIRSPWNEGADVARAKAAECRTFFAA